MLLVTTVVIAAAGAAALLAIVVAVMRSARLVVDGRTVTLRGATTVVADGWRLIEYRRNVGRQARWLWALFDEHDRPRLILDGARWSRALLTDAFAGTGVALSTAADRKSTADLDVIMRDQLEAFGESSDEALAARGFDPTVPPMPTGIVKD